MKTRVPVSQSIWFLPLLLLSTLALAASYKARPWTPRAMDSYPAKLTSEGITVAVDPLCTDALARQVFDKNDILTRGIMPLAVIVFNSNDFAVEVEGASCELNLRDDHVHPMAPDQAAQRVYQQKMQERPSRIPGGTPRLKLTSAPAEAVQDFKNKYFGIKRIGPKSTAGGFLFFPVPEEMDMRSYLADRRVYIPEISRVDTGASMIYFEIDLKPAIDALPKK